MKLQEKFNSLEKEVNMAVLERDDVIHHTILSCLAKQHVFLLGKPGTGKSYMAKKFAEAFDYIGSDNSRPYFQMQMSGGTEKSEIFGQVSLSKLKNDVLWYESESYLPNARIFLLDEITRSNKLALDAVLEPINERTYKNGGKVIKTPIEFGFATSNFKFNSEHFTALADRFVSWFEIDSLSEEGRSLLRRKKVNKMAITIKFTEAEVKQAREEAMAVTLSDKADKLIGEIRDTLASEHGIEISDRKEEALCDLVRAEAWLNCRTEAIEEDVLASIPCFWIDPEHKPIVTKLIRKLCNPQLEVIEEIKLNALTLMSNSKEQPTTYPLEDVSDQLKNFMKSLSAINPTPKNKEVYDKAIVTVKKLQEAVAELLLVKMKKVTI